MTSGNINGIPIIYKNIEAISKLSEIADYHLINNRDIYTSVDDSVTRVILGHERVIRRGRGYAPTYFKGNKFKESISLGAHLKNSFCLCKDEKIVLSQYIGDLQNEETINRYESALKSICSIYNLKPQLIAYDMHPNIFSSHFFNRFEGKRIGVYHHHAHIASVLFENNVENRVIGVAYDGTGYGIDGTIWGGEFLLADFKEFKRAAHLSLVKMPGGDMAAREPIRMITSYLCEIYKDRTEEILMGVLDKLRYDGNMLKEFMNIRMYMDMINKNINSPRTSSMGRLFDAVAYLLGFNQKVTFEGEAALYIENIANGCNSGSYDFEVKTGEEYVINTDRIIISIIKDLRNGVSKDVISKKFHNTIIKFTVDMCVRIWEDSGIKEVALSGGVFQNKILLEGIYNKLTARGFRVYTNKQIPCNDGGISIGQIAIANNREME